MKLYFDIERGAERVQVFRWLKKSERKDPEICFEHLGGIIPRMYRATKSGAWISDDMLTAKLKEFGADLNFDEYWTFGPNGSRKWHSCFDAMLWLNVELGD